MKPEDFDPIGALHTLLDHGVRFVLIGGFAGSLRGSPLITGDIDICYERSDQNLKALATALSAMHARLRGVDDDVPFLLDAETIRRGDAFTFVTDFGALDILAVPKGTNGFDDILGRADAMGIGVITVQVAALIDLQRMKRAAGRAKDQAALEWLRGVLGESDDSD